MTLFDPKSIQVLGADSNGNNVILCTMYVDTIADLPAPNVFTGNALSMGCRAIVINDNSVHRLNSAGQWVQIVPGTSTYTRAEIDTMISRIDATVAEDRAALVQLVDGGAKNKLKNTGISATVGEAIYTVNEDGTVTAYTSAETTASRTLTITQTADNCYVNAGDIITGLPDTSQDIAIQYGIGSAGNIVNYTPDEEYHTITVSGKIRYCLISIRAGVTIPQSSPLIIRPMVCTLDEYMISKLYVPYSPTNRELYDMIQSYHP